MTDLQLVNLKIDGKPVAAPRGTLVVDAAAMIGIEIPVFCYHPKLDPVGACRMCLVDIGTPRMGPDRKPMIDEATGEPVIAMMPKLQTACTSPISEGMVVITRNANADSGRKAVLEFLLTNHPLDCPVCDKGGECPLQDNTFKYGPSESRFIENKRHYEKPIPLSDRVVLDRERCILCYRCVRFQAEIAGDESLTTINRGSYSEIGVMPGRTFDSNFSGNTIEICPVGALTSTKYRFKARPWDIKHVPSVCAQCAVGCNVTIDVRKNEIMRLMSRENDAVDDGWLCDRGRFSFDYVHADNRLTEPMVRKNGKLAPVTWEEANAAVVARVRDHVARHGREAVGAVAHPSFTTEALYLFRKLFREGIGTPNVDHAPRATVSPVHPEHDAPLGSIQGLETAGAILLVGGDTLVEQPVLNLRLRKATRKKNVPLVIVNSARVDLCDDARVVLQPRTGAEAALLRGLASVTAGLMSDDDRPADLTVDSGITPESIEAETGVPAARLSRAATLLAAAAKPALLYPRAHAADWLEPLRTWHAFAEARSGGNPSFIGGLGTAANNQGALDLRLHPGDDLGQTVAGAGVKLLYVFGHAAVDEAALAGVECLIVHDTAASPLIERADVVLPGTAFAEEAGTFTNLERRVQRLTPAKLPPGYARENWRILADLAKALGSRDDYASPREVLREITRTVPPYANVTWEAAGRGGIQWAVPSAAAQGPEMAAD